MQKGLICSVKVKVMSPCKKSYINFVEDQITVVQQI